MICAIETKYCIACEEEVSTSLFAINRANSDGFQSRCKSCDNFRQAIRRLSKSAEIKAYATAEELEIVAKYMKDRKLP